MTGGDGLHNASFQKRKNILLMLRCICLTLGDGIMRSSKMTKRLIVIVCVAALLIAAAVVVALRERQSVPSPKASVEQASAKVLR